MIDIKDDYKHEHNPSIFIMFDSNFQIHWCYSGNVLRQMFLDSPENFISGPIEMPIPKYLDDEITYMYNHW